MRTLLTALTALMLFGTLVVAGDFEDGKFYFDAKKDHIAFPLLKPLAKQGMATITLGRERYASS
jgi:hypothetical protein